jgi:hypothetical protein
MEPDSGYLEPYAFLTIEPVVRRCFQALLVSRRKSSAANSFPTSMRGTIFAVVAIVAILVGAGAGYLIGIDNVHTVTSVSTSLLTTTFVTTALRPSFVNGLQLVISVSPLNLTQGQNVTISSWVYNPTSSALVVKFPGLENPSESPCELGSATAVDIYSGGYTFANLTGAAPLLQFNANVAPPQCDNIAPAGSHPQYTFLSYGENSTMDTNVFGGYYVYNSTGPAFHRYVFQRFPSGTYTVVVFDAWGQQQLGHFTVNSIGFAPYGLLYMSSEPGCYADGVPAICFGPLSAAVTFNCAIAAKSPSGCTQKVYINGSASKSNVVTVWYNATLGNITFGYSSGLSWINCKYSVQPPAGSGLPEYAYYVAVNSTSFLVAIPAPGPT